MLSSVRLARLSTRCTPLTRLLTRTGPARSITLRPLLARTSTLVGQTTVRAPLVQLASMSRSVSQRASINAAKESSSEGAAAASSVVSARSGSSTASEQAASDDQDDDSSDANQRFWWCMAGLSGALAVGLGAFGAHGLKARVTDVYFLDIWQTGAHYHLVHAVAMGLAPVVVAAMRKQRARTGQTVWQALRHNLGFGSKKSIAAAAVPRSAAARLAPYRNWAAASFLFGTVFFSGSLYALTLTENRKWGAVTPIGGFGFIFGWSHRKRTHWTVNSSGAGPAIRVRGGR